MENQKTTQIVVRKNRDIHHHDMKLKGKKASTPKRDIPGGRKKSHPLIRAFSDAQRVLRSNGFGRKAKSETTCI